MDRRGFTLIEMVIVVATAGAVLAISAPSLASAHRDWSVRGAAARFQSAHALARAASLQYGRTAELHIDVSANRFWVEVDTSAVGGVRDTIGIVNRLEPLGVELSSSRSLLCFDSRGMATSRGACDPADAVIVFETAGKRDTVRTTVLGKLLP